jgi:hypothetical protein
MRNRVMGVRILTSPFPQNALILFTAGPVSSLLCIQVHD